MSLNVATRTAARRAFLLSKLSPGLGPTSVLVGVVAAPVPAQAQFDTVSSHNGPYKGAPLPFAATALTRQLGTARRGFATTVADLQEKVDQLNDMFVEARDEIEYATEDAETVYFNESAETAKKAVAETIALWEEVLGQLEEEERGKLQRGMGLKMEQLKAELEGLDHLHAD